jgi:hypothetical protein
MPNANNAWVPGEHVPQPKPETLAEFELYNELIGAGGEALMGLNQSVIAQMKREQEVGALGGISREEMNRRFPNGAVYGGGNR